MLNKREWKKFEILYKFLVVGVKNFDAPVESSAVYYIKLPNLNKCMQ